MKLKRKHLHNREIQVPSQVQNSRRAGEEVPCKEYFPTFNPNVFIMARKNSGKTTLIYNILDRYTRDLGKKCKVLLFSPSVNKNDVWLAIQTMLEKRGISFLAKQFFKGKDPGGVKYDILEELESGIESRPDTTFICVFDDLGEDLKAKSLTTALTRNRHSNIVNILSGHDVVDLKPKGLTQIDYFILLPNISSSRILELHKKVKPAIGTDDFLELYKYSTSKPYNFLYMSRDPELYRHNFNEALEVEIDSDSE